MNALYRPEEIEQRFFRRKGCRSLRASELEKLKADGVDPVFVGLPEPVLVVQVVFGQSGSFAYADEIDLPDEVSLAFTILCRDEDGEAIDILAWWPSTGRVVTWLGCAWALGQDKLLQPRINDADALAVHESPLDWLRSGREGLVVLDPNRARWELATLQATLIVNNVKLGQALRAALTIRPATILVALSKIDRAAA